MYKFNFIVLPQLAAKMFVLYIVSIRFVVFYRNEESIQNRKTTLQVNRQLCGLRNSYKFYQIFGSLQFKYKKKTKQDISDFRS